eukprot:jgi/Chlat1/8502/Chrsp80S07935
MQECLCGAGYIEASKLLHSMHFVSELPLGTLQQFTAVMSCSSLQTTCCRILYGLLTSSQMVRTEWSQKELKEFLQFTTGLCAVPIHGLCNPQATADNRIKELKQRFQIAFSWALQSLGDL